MWVRALGPRGNSTNASVIQLIMVVNKMIINWEMNHINLLQARKNSNIDTREGRTDYSHHYLSTFVFFKTNWRWKSLNKEVVIETGGPKLTQAQALRWLKGPEVKGKSNKMGWNNSSALSGPLSNLLRWNKNHCQRCSDIYLLAHWLCEDRKLFQPPLQWTPANHPEPEEGEEEY